MSETDESEKEFEATAHKLEEARKRGDLVRSSEITVAAAYVGFLLTALAVGGSSLKAFGTQAMILLEQADSLSQAMLSGGSATAGVVLGRMAFAVAPWFVIPAGLVLASLIAQRAIVVASDKIQFKGNRINPIANAAQKFGRSGLFEFAKSFVKLVVISILLGKFILDHFDQILLSQRLGAPMAAADLGQMIVEFVVLVALISAVVGAIDYFWQRAEHLRRNRMSRKELMDEMKQSEGDPHMKSQRRQRAVEIATSQMIADTAKADVVIVNPTHYAVALQWKRESKRPPVCLAKGVDEIAARIREIAMEHGVPIHSDPPTARALYATIEIGDEIHPDHYKPVAAAIRFAEKMRQKAKARKW